VVLYKFLYIYIQTIKLWQLHLDIKQLNIMLSVVESEFENTNKELNGLLSDLEKQYPNGEIDLIEGTVIF
jgi:hypothetical protein